MADLKEEAYVLEKMEISEDDDEGFDYKEIKDLDDVEDEEPDLLLESMGMEEDDDDLNDFTALKDKTEKLRIAVARDQAAKTGVIMKEPIAGTIVRDVVIDDFIRNFLTQYKMSKTLNIFHSEWHELQKKGTFHDVNLGLITDSKNKNIKLKKKIDKLEVELTIANKSAEQSVSTWEKLRKERDFHKTHQDRVNSEKVTIAQNIKKMKDLHEDYEEKIEEIQKKHLTAVKEKALLKLEKDKLQKKVNDLQNSINSHEQKVQKQIDASMKKQRMGGRIEDAAMVKGQNTPWPEDARPNPYLSQTFEDIIERMSMDKKVDAHSQGEPRGIGGMALHAKKQIVATAGDDCTWKIWNLDNKENIMTGEGHKDWICAVDFHPAGSHLITGGGDKCIKVWDFINSSIAHTFQDVHTAPIWKLKFHDSGDFILSSSGDGSIKLFDLNSLKLRQQFRSHTDSVNGLNFQPFTNFFVSGSADKTTSVWDMRSGLTVQTFYGHLNTINDAVFSIGGQYVSTCDSDGIVKIWDIRMVQELLTVDVGDTIAHCVAFDKKTKILAVGCSDGEVRIINMEKQQISNQIKAHEDAINAIYINHDNQFMYTASNDGTVRSWK